MITRMSNSSILFQILSRCVSKPHTHQVKRLSYHHLVSFSNVRKDKKQQKSQVKRKSYNLDGINKNKLPQHLKTVFQLNKQTINLQVVSQAQLQNQVIVSEIKRQRLQIQSSPSQQELKQLKISQAQKFLLGLTGLNLGTYAFLYFPIISNHMYWLGVYSSILLYPSLIITTSISIGINLAYLILRQSLIMNESVQKIKKVNITQSPKGQYLEMILISMQFFSLAVSASIPLTLLKLGQDYKNTGLYAVLFFLLSTNAHLTIQKRFFPNRLLHISSQATCFILLFLLSAYTYLEYNMSQTKCQNQDNRKFKEGQNKIKNLWRIKKVNIKRNEKITDIINSDDQNYNEVQSQKVTAKQK